MEVDVKRGLSIPFKTIKNWAANTLDFHCLYDLRDCSFSWGLYSEPIKVEVIPDQEFDWEEKYFAMGPTVDGVKWDDVREFLRHARSDNDSFPTLHILVADYYERPEAENWFSFPDDPYGTIFGFSSINRTKAFNQRIPYGVIFIGTIYKFINDTEEWAHRKGWDFWINEEGLISKILGHELCHQLGLEEPVEECHDDPLQRKACCCIMNPLYAAYIKAAEDGDDAVLRSNHLYALCACDYHKDQAVPFDTLLSLQHKRSR